MVMKTRSNLIIPGVPQGSRISSEAPAWVKDTVSEYVSSGKSFMDAVVALSKSPFFDKTWVQQ